MEGGGERGEGGEEGESVLDLRVDSDFVFPFELGPHRAEFQVGAVGWVDVIHDVYVDLVEYHHVVVGSKGGCLSCDVVHHVTKYDSILCRGNLFLDK